MTITVTEVSGRRKTMDAPLSMEIQRDLYVPADSLKAMFLLEGKASEIMFIDVRSNSGKRLFTGRVDRQVAEHSQEGRIMTITARSSAAVLVDNMVMPRVFEKCCFSEMFRIIAVPLGITGLRGDFLMQDTLRIGMGTTAWGALCRACEVARMRRPWVDSSDRVTIGGFPESPHLSFSNQRSGATPFLSASMEWNRHQEISSVVYKNRFNQPGRMITQEDALRRGILRQVILSSSMQDLSARYYEANNKIKTAQGGARAMQVVVAGQAFYEMGTPASVSDSYIGRSPLRVTGLRYVLDKTGERTYLTLWDRDDVY